MNEPKIIKLAASDFERFRADAAPLFINVFEDARPIATLDRNTEQAFESLDEAAFEATESGYLYTIYVSGKDVTLLDLESHGNDLCEQHKQERRDQEEYERDCSSLELAGRV